MGQLVVGVAVGALGQMVGIPFGVGFMVGSMAFSLIDQPKVYGPKLNDTKVRGADYGQMVPILYGTCRIGGWGEGQGSIVNGPNEFTEHEEGGGGKGGPEQVNYRYTLSFFNGICEGPILGVWRRWANGRLITDAMAPSSSVWPYTLYLGDATQLPDPTMELVYGVGEVSPMRGRAYESVEEVDVIDYGNARPNVEYEAFTTGGTIPWRVSTFDPWTFLNRLGFAATYHDGVITASSTTSTNPTHYFEARYKIDGTQIGTEGDQEILGTINHDGSIRNLNSYALRYSSGIDVVWWNPDPINPGTITEGYTISPGVFTAPEAVAANQNVYMDGYIYTHGGGIPNPSPIGRYRADGGIPTDFVDYTVLDSQYAPSNVALGTSDTGHLYVMVVAASGPDDIKMWRFNPDLSLDHFWDVADTAGTQLQVRGNFHVYKGLICFQSNPEFGLYEIALVKINEDESLVDHGSQISSANSSFVINLAGGLMLDAVGVFSLDPPPGMVILGDIVSDLLQRAGLSPGQIDVTDLTQEVRGFVVASQMTVRNAIDVLRKAYFFDVTEYDGKIVCRNRGHGATETIPDGDLAAHVPGSEPPEPLEVTRVPEAELPRTVFINFYNYDNEYQTGSQYWRRTVTLSQSDVTLDLPLVFTAGEALQRAQWHMHFAWLERDRFTFYVSDQWCRLRPTDVVVVRGVNIRLTSVTESPTGIIKCEGVRAFAGAFTGDNLTDPIDGDIPGDSGGGQPPQEPPSEKADTGFVLIDGPWISEADAQNTMRVAMWKDGSGSWSGASLLKSMDGGTTYTAIGSTTSQSIVGTTVSALGDFSGGDTVDELNVLRVSLTNASASLSSATADGLLNGLNLIAVGAPSGWEFLQYRTATLVSAGVWDLTGLVRGRFGTEWMMSSHGVGEVFVLISSTILVPFVQAETLLSLKYKAVTFGTAVADAVATDFVNNAVSLKPWAPVLLGGGRNAAGDLILNWTPRRRGSGGWPDGVDLPSTEASEAYLLRFYSDGTYTTIVRQPGTVSTTYTYTAAMQTTDFGSPQSTVYWRVAKAGAAGYGYYAEAAT